MQPPHMTPRQEDFIIEELQRLEADTIRAAEYRNLPPGARKALRNAVDQLVKAQREIWKCPLSPDQDP